MQIDDLIDMTYCNSSFTRKLCWWFTLQSVGEVATFVSSYPVTTFIVGDSPLPDFESEYFPQDLTTNSVLAVSTWLVSFSKGFLFPFSTKSTNRVLGATGVPSAGYLPMQALQVALVLRIVESLQILRMKGPGAEILGVFFEQFCFFGCFVQNKKLSCLVCSGPEQNHWSFLQESTSLGKIHGQNRTLETPI